MYLKAVFFTDTHFEIFFVKKNVPTYIRDQVEYGTTTNEDISFFF